MRIYLLRKEAMLWGSGIVQVHVNCGRGEEKNSKLTCSIGGSAAEYGGQLGQLDFSGR